MKTEAEIIARDAHRRAKNRESAHLSRKKRRIQVEALKMFYIMHSKEHHVDLEQFLQNVVNKFMGYNNIDNNEMRDSMEHFVTTVTIPLPKNCYPKPRGRPPLNYSASPYVPPSPKKISKIKEIGDILTGRDEPDSEDETNDCIFNETEFGNELNKYLNNMKALKLFNIGIPTPPPFTESHLE